MTDLALKLLERNATKRAAAAAALRPHKFFAGLSWQVYRRPNPYCACLPINMGRLPLAPSVGYAINPRPIRVCRCDAMAVGLTGSPPSSPRRCCIGWMPAVGPSKTNIPKTKRSFSALVYRHVWAWPHGLSVGGRHKHPLESSRRDGHNEYRHVYTHAARHSRRVMGRWYVVAAAHPRA